MSLQIYPGGIRGLGWTITKSPEWSNIIQRSVNSYEVGITQWTNPIWHWTLVYNYLKDNPLDLPAYFDYSDYKILQGFILARKLDFDAFLFNDLYDNSVGPALATTPWVARLPVGVGHSILDSANHWQQITTQGITGSSVPTFNHAGSTTNDGTAVWTDRGLYTASGFPNPLAQLQLVNDGAGNYYSPIQRNFGGQFYEDITDLNGSITVYANGVVQALTTNYTVLGPGLAIPGFSFQGMYLKWVGTPATPITAAFNFYFRVRIEGSTVDFEQFMQQLWTMGGPYGQRGSGMLKLITKRPNPVA